MNQHHKLNLDEPLGNSAISIAAQSDSYKEFFSDLGDLFDKKEKVKSDHFHSGDKPGASDLSQTFGEDNKSLSTSDDHDGKKTSDLTQTEADEEKKGPAKPSEGNDTLSKSMDEIRESIRSLVKRKIKSELVKKNDKLTEEEATRKKKVEDEKKKEAAAKALAAKNKKPEPPKMEGAQAPIFVIGDVSADGGSVAASGSGKSTSR